MNTFGKKEGDHHKDIDGFGPELFEGIADRGRIHVHETALDNKMGIIPRDERSGLQHELLIIGEFAPVAHQ
jgi:hypothetical protein